MMDASENVESRAQRSTGTESPPSLPLAHRVQLNVGPDMSSSKPSSGPQNVKKEPWKCAALSAASLKCLDKNQMDKEKCQDAFDEYLECRKQEREERIAKNRSKSIFS